MRILLAEDERELATWLVRALAQSDFQVDWVDDGRMVRRSLKAIGEKPMEVAVHVRMSEDQRDTMNLLGGCIACDA